MRTTRYLLFGALGVAAVLLLSSDGAKKMRDDLRKKAKDNAGKWKGKLWDMGNGARSTLSELRTLLDSEVEGLSNSAREKIETILNKTAQSADGLKRNFANKLS